MAELANQVKRNMAKAGEPATELMADAVGRWESGDRIPTPVFRKHLVMLFNRTADELGLLSADEMALRPASPPAPPETAENGLVADLVANAVRQVLDVVRDERSRGARQVLVGSMIDGTATILGPTPDSGAQGSHASRPPVSRVVQRQVVDEFTRIAAAQQRLYFTADADTLMDVALHHLRLGVDFLIMHQRDTADFRMLARSVALTSLLAARVAFFDLGDAPLAAGCFSLATRAVASAGDHALSAAVHGHQAFVPGLAGNLADARRFLDAAHAHVWLAPSPRLRSWLHCVSAEIAARNGEVKASLHHIRQAEQALSTRGTDPDWLDYFDEARWAAFAGQTHLLAGNTRQAVSHLTAALRQLPATDKQRSVLLLDLAVAQSAVDAEVAAATAHQALDLLAVLPYAAAMTRLPHVTAALQGTSLAEDLHDRIRALSSAEPPGAASRNFCCRTESAVKQW